MRMSMGRGRYVASEDDVVAAPIAAWAQPTSYRGIVYCGGYGQTATSMWPYGGGSHDFVVTLAQRFPMITTDLGGPAVFGNNTSITRVGQAKTYLQTRCAKAGKIYLAFGSMGTLSALNWARTNSASVAAAVGIVPVPDFNAFYTANRGGYAAEVNTAYGGTYSVATDGPTHSPSQFAASLNFPIKLWYGSTDVLSLPAEVEAFAAACPDCEIVQFAGGHGAYPNATYNPDVSDFLAAHP